MSRCVQQLLRSTWCRWQLVTSLPLPANQEALSVAHQWSPTALGVVRGGWRRPSVRLLHRAGPQYCGGAESSPGAAGPNDDDDDDLGRPAIAKTSMPEGPEGAAASTDQDGNSLAGLVLGKTYVPPVSTDSLVFGGIPYYKLPVIHIKATYNNTHVNITDHSGKRSYTRTTCGAEGFKNAKKGTTIAAQTVGIAAATKALDKGLKTVRVVVKGIGPGRQASIKGLQMGGLDIVSITDNTPIPHNGARPRKARRL